MIIAIDIGGTKCAVAKSDDNGVILDSVSFATTTRDETLARIFDETAKFQPDNTVRFGISCGGPLDASRGIIMSPPNLPTWDNVPITQLFTQRFGGQAWLMNDANAGALAEWKYGAGRGCRNMIFLTHGTGMGGGLILNGQLYEGTTGDAGEAGHIRMAEYGPVGYGKAGSFEGFCSGSGIAKLAAGRIPGIQNPTAKDVFLLAENGLQEAIAILNESGRYLGRALAVLIDILNPEVIVLGSIYMRGGHLLEKAMRKALEEETLPTALAACRIVPAQLKEATGLTAAAMVAIYRSQQ